MEFPSSLQSQAAHVALLMMFLLPEVRVRAVGHAAGRAAVRMFSDLRFDLLFVVWLQPAQPFEAQGKQECLCYRRSSRGSG